MNILTSNAHWLLRIALASVLLYHGGLKFLHLEGFAEMLPISYTQVVLVALAETAGGLLILFGGVANTGLTDLSTRIGAALNIPVVIGAIALVHWGQWSFVPSETHPMGGFEFQAVLILLMLYLVLTGNDSVSRVSRKTVPVSRPRNRVQTVAGETS